MIFEILIEMLEQITFFHDSLLLVIPALLILGYAVKRTPSIPEWLNIWILLMAGTLASIAQLGFSVNGIANGFISAGIALAILQGLGQLRNRK